MNSSLWLSLCPLCLCGESSSPRRIDGESSSPRRIDEIADPFHLTGRSEPPMQAILLAGGKGTRLRPFTHVFPKPLMPLGDAEAMPIIEVVLRQLARFGFRDVSIITGYLTELIEAFCGDGRKFGAELTYHREVTPLGTAGGLTLIP